MTTVYEAVSELVNARILAESTSPPSDSRPDFDATGAYEVQDAVLARRIDAGETTTGVKVGLTSAASRKVFGAGRPALGWLTDAMRLPTNAAVGDGLRAPLAEPEIAFTLRERLAGPGVTPAAALAAVESVHAAIEIVDSRYNTRSFTHADLIADNCMAARYVTGPVALAPQGLDLALEGCLLEVDGQIVDSATGAASDGSPAEALAAAANQLGERGLALEAGWTVLTGTLVDPVPIAEGTAVTVHFAHLGSITISGA